MMKRKRQLEVPALPLLEAELKREYKKTRFASMIRSTTNILLVVASLAVLVATLLTPVLQIYGSSMTPTLKAGQFVVSVKGTKFTSGDLVSFYLGNKLLVKRIIAVPGDWVDIKADGTVFVNGEELDEPYVKDKAFGQCDLELPYQVPESRYFMMGDHRESSLDSRSSVIGCVAEDQIVGKIVLCLWPLKDFGIIQ
jgi:signal peptidase I